MKVNELMAALAELLKSDGAETYDVVLTTVSGVEHKLEAISWGDKKLYMEGAEEGETFPFRCPDPLGPNCHDDRCKLHYGELPDDVADQATAEWADDRPDYKDFDPGYGGTL